MIPDLREIQLTINGAPRALLIETRMHLADALRKVAGLTGTHLGCEHGVCGACTVIVSGQPVRACLMLAVQAEGLEVLTSEGLRQSDGALHPVQAAMAAEGGLQCGFCTPGVLATLVTLLEEDADRSEAEIREAVSAHLCRCTGYQAIVAAGVSAAHAMREGAA